MRIKGNLPRVSRARLLSLSGGMWPILRLKKYRTGMSEQPPFASTSPPRVRARSPLELARVRAARVLKDNKDAISIPRARQLQKFIHICIGINLTSIGAQYRRVYIYIGERDAQNADLRLDII